MSDVGPARPHSPQRPSVRPRRWARLVLSAALVAVAMEGCVRLIADDLPLPQRWSAPELPVKEEQISELALTGGASIVFLGSSTMDAAADPSSFDLDPDRPAYNASVGAGSMPSIDVWARMVAIPILRPDVVVLGVVSRDLNPNDAQQALNETKFLDSTAVRRFLGNETLLERAERKVESLSAVVEYRSVIRQPSRVWSALRNGEFRTGEFGEVVAPDGQYEGFLDQRFDRERVTHEALQRTVLKDFEIGETQLGTLTDLLGYLTEQVERVVVVNMPVAQVYVAAHPGEEVGYERAVEAVRGAAEQAGCQFVDLGPWPDSLMADMGHVNVEGVRRFTQDLQTALAADPG